ncbi:LysM peptidoglycan-binding domain-containing protein [Arthrobacter sp. H5]|uniref:LysM peptidoglycan-binding domain-containing protein n=1 Tax=Arthrobacter sp. H5 TaxID=1267973 RepID=UPI000487E75F|nr:LysM peptidoglycan-binding domain-containing protein [Arthrobacter sp. H5]
MSRNRHIARHRATPASPLKTLSQAVTSHAGSIGRPAAVVVAASGLMLGGVALPANAGTTAPVQQATAATEVAPAQSAAPAAAPSAQTASASAAATHTVQSGDTLGSISSNYGVSLEAIFAANGLGWDSVIYPGDVIALSGGAGAAPSAPAPQAQAAPAPQAQLAPAPAEVAPAPADSSTMGITTASSNITVASYSAPASSGKAATIAAAAQSQVGVSQDCTKLVTNALAAAGINFHDWPAGYLSLGSTVSEGQAVPGDLVYYADGGAGVAHIGVYIGGGQAVHGGFNGNQTVVAPVHLGSGPVFIHVGG